MEDSGVDTGDNWKTRGLSLPLRERARGTLCLGPILLLSGIVMLDFQDLGTCVCISLGGSSLFYETGCPPSLRLIIQPMMTLIF